MTEADRVAATPPSAPESDAALAVRLARGAGALLVTLRTELRSADPRELRAAGDARSHEWLATALGRARPADAVLSEEGVDDPARLSADRVWIVDPLDGTREFAESGRVDWAVHVALWSRSHGGLVAGAVALPGQGVVLASDPAPALPPASPGPPRLVVSRTRPPAAATAVAEALSGELVPLGSAGAKAMAVVQGVADAYVHSGGQYEWDSAAPVAVAAAAGLHTSRIDGSPLLYNATDPRLPDLVICRPELAGAILAVTA
jgi:3'(2'), 5'-bisphosphate nucleotidase